MTCAKYPHRRRICIAARETSASLLFPQPTAVRRSAGIMQVPSGLCLYALLLTWFFFQVPGTSSVRVGRLSRQGYAWAWCGPLNYAVQTAI
jgi:hypothetical protein